MGLQYSTTMPQTGDNLNVLFRKLSQVLGATVDASDNEYDSIRKTVEVLSNAMGDANNGVALGDTEYQLARKLLIAANVATA
jgi:uncharacterized protein YukE